VAQLIWVAIYIDEKTSIWAWLLEMGTQFTTTSKREIAKNNVGTVARLRARAWNLLPLKFTAVELLLQIQTGPKLI
jgi:hypothetical protein